MSKYCEDCVHNEVCEYGAYCPTGHCNDKNVAEDYVPTGEWINVDAYSKWLKEQTIIGFDYEHCEVLIGRNGVWHSAIKTYLKERSEEE